MQLVSRAEYEQRSWDLAWIALGKGAFPALLIAAAIWFASIAGFRVSGAETFLGMAFAFAMPTLVNAMGYVSGGNNDRAIPSVAVAISGQLAMLFVFYLALGA